MLYGGDSAIWWTQCYMVGIKQYDRAALVQHLAAFSTIARLTAAVSSVLPRKGNYTLYNYTDNVFIG